MLTLDTGQYIQLQATAVLVEGKSSCHPLGEKLGVPQNLSGRCVQQKKFVEHETLTVNTYDI